MLGLHGGSSAKCEFGHGRLNTCLFTATACFGAQCLHGFTSTPHQSVPPPVSQSLLDEMGAEPDSTAQNAAGDLVVARPEAVYFYSADGRGPCFVFEGAD